MQHAMTHSVESATLADVLERVLDKGIVIAGDIKIKLVEIELLTIQIRLMIASVEKAKEMGMDWWVNNPQFSSRAEHAEKDKEIESLKLKVARLEQAAPSHCAAQKNLPHGMEKRRGRRPAKYSLAVQNTSGRYQSKQSGANSGPGSPGSSAG